MLARPSVAARASLTGSVHRPDGTIKYAENPPKKYQDIVNVDFYAERFAVPSLWTTLRDIVLFWAERGVRLFRVDNPHTKPFPFWRVDDRRRASPVFPDAIFLAEAFTKPKVMYRLAKGRVLAVLHVFHVAQRSPRACANT